MKKIIRWPGFIVFLAVTAIFSVLWIFFIDRIAEKAIERYCTDINKALVELDSTDVTLSPLGVSIGMIQVTDPDNPMVNSVEIASSEFSLDGLNLLRRKIIINKMLLDNVQFNTPRKRSGAIEKIDEKITPVGSESDDDSGAEDKKELISLPSLDIPDVGEILEKESLHSIELAESLKKDIEDEKERLNKEIDELPDDDDLKEYKKRIKGLKSSKLDIKNLISGVKDARDIKEDIENDLARINSLKKDFKNTLASLEERIDELEESPKEDIKILQDKYSLSSQGLGNFSHLLFGSKIGGIADSILPWYERAKPYIVRIRETKREKGVEGKPVRGKGVNIIFAEYEPLPDFLIKRVESSVKVQMGGLSGEINHITTDPAILGIPCTFHFSGDSMRNARSMEINGMSDHVNPEDSRDTADLELVAYQLNDVVLSDQKPMPIIIKEALLDLVINTGFQDSVLTADVVAKFRSVRLFAGLEKSAGVLTQTVARSLSGISNFVVEAQITGRPGDFDTDITSDLDKIIKGALGNAVDEQTAVFKKEINAAVREKVKGPIKDLKARHEEMGPSGDSIDERLASLKDILKGLD